VTELLKYYQSEKSFVKVDEPEKTPTDIAIEQCTSNIEKKSLFLHEKHTWLTKGQRDDIRFDIQKLMANREKLVGDGQKDIVLLKSLYVPGPQSEEERIELLRLIDSV
jgi:hypothetical protein